MNRSANRLTHWLVLVVILSVGFLLRTWDLQTVPLRGDEAFAAEYWAGLPFTDALTRIAPIEPHPPLTYALFSLWGRLVGTDSEFALRFLPALFNLVGAAVLYVLGRRLHSPTVGLLAALVWALHPFEIWHARDFRNYAIWATLSALTLYWGWRAVTTPARHTLLVYSLAALVGSLLFYFELFTIGALLLWGTLSLRPQRRVLLQWWVVNLTVIGITAVVFLGLQRQLIGAGGYGGNTAPFSLSALLTVFPATFVFGDSFPPATLQLLSIGVLVGLMVGGIILYQSSQRRVLLFLLCMLMLPVIGLAVGSARISVFTPRYVIGVVTPMLLLFVCAGVEVWKRGRVGQLIVGLLVAGTLIVMAQSLSNQLNDIDYRKSPDWYAVRAYLAQHVSADDTMIQTTVDASFGYYINPLVRTAAIPSQPTQSHAETDEVMRKLADESATLWLFEHSFYDWSNAHAARDWLDSHWMPITTTRLMGKPLTRYAPLAISAAEMQPTQPVVFGDTVTLASAHYTVTQQDMTVWLYWQAPTTDRWTASVQLIGALNPANGSPVWAQSDLPLPASSVQTRDVRLLVLTDVPPGNYDLIVKVYDPVSSDVLPAGSGENVRLGSVTIPVQGSERH